MTDTYWSSGVKPARDLTRGEYLERSGVFSQIVAIREHPSGWLIVATTDDEVCVDPDADLRWAGEGAVEEAREWGRSA